MDISYFAHTNFRSQSKPFGIRQNDHFYHLLAIGKTGTGKTSLLKTMILDNIQAGRGACFKDPHSDAVTDILHAIPEHRKKDEIYFNIPDPELTLRYNPFKLVSYEKRPLVATCILEVLEKLWSTAWGAKLEHILRYSILTLLDQPSATFADIPKLLLDKSFRRQTLSHIVSEEVRAFWRKELSEYNKYDLLPVLNKIDSMLAHHVIKRVLNENKEEYWMVLGR